MEEKFLHFILKVWGDMRFTEIWYIRTLNVRRGGPQFFGLIVPLFLLLLHDVRVVVFIYVVPPAKRMRLQQGDEDEEKALIKICLWH